MSVKNRLIEEQTAWDDLVEMEPQLGNLAFLARCVHQPDENLHVWGLIKLALTLLVGNEARHPQLRTSYHYDVAYDHVQCCFEEGK